MKKGKVVIVLAIILGLSVAVLMNMEKDDYPYILQNKAEIAELNSVCYVFEHKKTAAKVIHIKNDDDNKVFSIGFKTPAMDNTGATHIIEHSVLCGSEKYPVKDPFLIMSKQSLNTFLNAITYADMTMYPIASRNNKDFFNLMDVYCDGVFFPNMRNDKRIFMQEGWHYELVDGELISNGIVLNEMRGAYASADDMLFQALRKNLFPDTSYVYESGGDPHAITSLTYKKFINIYNTYYHPSNSYIYVYGDIDIEKVLDKLDNDYLSRFNKIEVNNSIAIQPGFEKGKRVVEEYASNAKGKNIGVYIAKAYVMGHALDKKNILELDILNDLLLGTSASPLKAAITKAHISEQVYTDFDTNMQQPVFSIICENADKSKQDLLYSIIDETLMDIVKKGFDKQLINATINSYEMNLREANTAADRGLALNEDVLKAWIYGGDPMTYLTLDEFLKDLKENINPHYFDKMIMDMYINNTHFVEALVLPNANMEQEYEIAEKNNMLSMLESMTKQEIDNIAHDVINLKKWQDRADTFENINKVPSLSLKEVNKKHEKIPIEVVSIANIDIMKHDIYTNGLAYLDFYFDASAIPQEDLLYLFLLSNEFLGNISTKNYSYDDLINEMGVQTGSLDFNIKNYSIFNTDEIHLYLNIETYTTYDKIGNTFNLISEMINETIFTDKKRMHQIIREAKADLKGMIEEHASSLATRRVLSYISDVEACNDLMFIPMYRLLEELDKDFDNRYEALCIKLKEICSLLFIKENVTIGVTAEENAFESLIVAINKMAKNLRTAKLGHHKYVFEKEKKNEALILSGNVAYVAQGFNIKKQGYEFNGHMRVLQNIIESEYLWQEIRVKGGAYGAYSEFNANGNIAFYSYRDPHVEETYDIIRRLPDYVGSFDADKKAMDNLIIGTIGQIEPLKGPWAKGKTADRMYLCGITQEYMQKIRNEILDTDVEDIRNFAQVLKEGIDEGNIVTVGNRAKIKKAKHLFKSIEDAM